MSEEKKEKYWVPDELDENQAGLCTLNDTEGRYRCYVKWDDTIHFWFYGGDRYGFDCDTGKYGADARKTGHHEYYRYIGGVEDLDEMIAQLQAIKTTASEWYAKRGRRWPPDWDAYVKGEKTIEEAQKLDLKDACN